MSDLDDLEKIADDSTVRTGRVNARGAKIGTWRSKIKSGAKRSTLRRLFTMANKTTANKIRLAKLGH